MSQRSTWPRVFAAIWGVFCYFEPGSQTDSSLIAGEFRAWDRTGRVFEIQQFLGDQPEQIQFEDRHGERTSLLRAVRISTVQRFPERLTQARSCLLTLVTGDQVWAEPVDLRQDAGEFRLFDDQLVTIPWAAAQHLEHPPGWRIVRSDRAESGTTWTTGSQAAVISSEQFHRGRSAIRCGPENAAVENRWPTPIYQGQISLWFRDDPETLTAPWNWTCDWGTTDQPFPLEVSVGGTENSYQARVPSGQGLHLQGVARSPGWHQLTVACDDTSLRISLDEQLLAWGPRPVGGGCQSCQWKLPDSSNPQAFSVAQSLWCDDLLVTAHDQPSKVIPSDRMQATNTQQDVIRLWSGDERYGLAQGAGGTRVVLDSPLGVVDRDWTEISRISFRPRPWSAPSVRGLQASLGWTALDRDANWEQRQIRVAVQRIRGTEWDVIHPVLGKLRVPLSEVRQLTPGFLGTVIPIQGRPIHMGDEIKSRFLNPVPVGTSWSRDFTVAEMPAGTPRMACEVSDLEPAGKWTSSVHQHLADVLAGRLTTSGYLNGRPLGVLNAQVEGQLSVSRPTTVQLKIPAGSLHTGQNRWELRGTSDGHSYPEYDDFQLHSTRLEFVEEE